MDTSDESVVAQLTDFNRSLPGGKKLTQLDPVLRRQARKVDDKRDEEERLKTEAAAKLDEEKRTVTAEPATQESEIERRNRLRRRSPLTRGFAQPTLSTPGLLG